MRVGIGFLISMARQYNPANIHAIQSIPVQLIFIKVLTLCLKLEILQCRHWAQYKWKQIPHVYDTIKKAKFKQVSSSMVRLSFNSQLQKCARTGTSCLYWLDWKATQPSLRVFSGKLFKWESCKSCKFHTNPYNFVACLPNPYKLSNLGDIWRATIFLLQIVLFLVKTLKFSWSFIWIS